MAFSNEEKNKIWERYFGDNYEAEDAFGRGINKDNFDADHIYPESRGGSDDIRNGIPLHEQSNAEKADNLEGIINNCNFKVIDIYNGIGLLWVNDKKVSK